MMYVLSQSSGAGGRTRQTTVTSSCTIAATSTPSGGGTASPDVARLDALQEQYDLLSRQNSVLVRTAETAVGASSRDVALS